MWRRCGWDRGQRSLDIAVQAPCATNRLRDSEFRWPELLSHCSSRTMRVADQSGRGQSRRAGRPAERASAGRPLGCRTERSSWGRGVVAAWPISCGAWLARKSVTCRRIPLTAHEIRGFCVDAGSIRFRPDAVANVVVRRPRLGHCSSVDEPMPAISSTVLRVSPQIQHPPRAQ